MIIADTPLDVRAALRAPYEPNQYPVPMHQWFSETYDDTETGGKVVWFFIRKYLDKPRDKKKFVGRTKVYTDMEELKRDEDAYLDVILEESRAEMKARALRLPLL